MSSDSSDVGVIEQSNWDYISNIIYQSLNVLSNYSWIFVLLAVYLAVDAWINFHNCLPPYTPLIEITNKNQLEYNNGDELNISTKTYNMTPTYSKYSIEPANRGLAINNDGVISGVVNFEDEETELKLIISVSDDRDIYCSDASTEITIIKKTQLNADDD